MVGTRLNVHLYRDSFNTPWGFRLQGGTDLNQSLVVQRVFSNSPAEGELQRGDVILSINNRDGTTLTHKQAQDLIKHGGGQVQLVVQRPPPGTQVAPLSPPIVTQRPRAPSLQVRDVQNIKRAIIEDGTPATAAYVHHVKSRLERLKKHLDLQAQYGPRKREESEPQEEREPDKLATGPIPKTCNLKKIGGGNHFFGSSYVGPSGQSETLPRRSSSSSRQTSQPPKMPSAGGSGFMPTKITMNKFGGGGGPSFGQDYSSGVKSPAQSDSDIILEPEVFTQDEPEVIPQGEPEVIPQGEIEGSSDL